MPHLGLLLAAGYVVLLPDFFHGDAVDKHQERQSFWKAHPFPDTYPEVDAVLEHIKSQYGGIPVGVEGFCYGGHFAIRLAGEWGVNLNPCTFFPCPDHLWPR